MANRNPALPLPWLRLPLSWFCEEPYRSNPLPAKPLESQFVIVTPEWPDTLIPSGRSPGLMTLKPAQSSVTLSASITMLP